MNCVPADRHSTHLPIQKYFLNMPLHQASQIFWTKFRVPHFNFTRSRKKFSRLGNEKQPPSFVLENDRLTPAPKQRKCLYCSLNIGQRSTVPYSLGYIDVSETHFYRIEHHVEDISHKICICSFRYDTYNNGAFQISLMRELSTVATTWHYRSVIIDYSNSATTKWNKLKY